MVEPSQIFNLNGKLVLGSKSPRRNELLRILNIPFLDELAKNQDINIDERSVKGFFPFFKYLDRVSENFYDVLIGAGHKTHSFLLDIKKYQKPETKTIAILIFR